MVPSKQKIGWITMSLRKDGGNNYTKRVIGVLSDDYDISLAHVNPQAKYFQSKIFRFLKPVEWFFNYSKFKGEKDLWITHSFLDTALLALSRVKGKKLAVIYHIDTAVFPWYAQPGFYLIKKLFYYNLKKFDGVVTISNYWRDHFLERGYQNVYKVHCGFDTNDFNITDEEVEEFKRKHNLSKPIIYIGNCQKDKGVVGVYEALKDLDVHLITSGEKRVDIPALNLDLERKEYLKLSKASSIAIFMTQFNTGWDMTAHEAMFFKTPVIGSERGAMREFLEGAGQTVCQDFDCVREKVKYLLSHPEERQHQGMVGYNFAKQFPLERFKREWLEVIRKVVND